MFLKNSATGLNIVFIAFHNAENICFKLSIVILILAGITINSGTDLIKKSKLKLMLQLFISQLMDFVLIIKIVLENMKLSLQIFILMGQAKVIIL